MVPSNVCMYQNGDAETSSNGNVEQGSLSE